MPLNVKNVSKNSYILFCILPILDYYSLKVGILVVRWDWNYNIGKMQNKMTEKHITQQMKEVISCLN